MELRKNLSGALNKPTLRIKFPRGRKSPEDFADSAPPKAEEKKGKKREFTPAEEVQAFLMEFDLSQLLPREFWKLTDAQQLKVTRDLKRRIVDIVKSDAQTQYSEEFKKKMKRNADPSVFEHVGAKTAGVRNIITSISSSIAKESDVKNLENKVFGQIKNTEEGKRLIGEDIKKLTELTAKNEVHISHEGRPYVAYVNFDSVDSSAKEVNIIYNFNQKANEFASMPYEWGQEAAMAVTGHQRIGTRNRAQYEKAKAEYIKAKNEILKIKAGKEQSDERGKAILEVSVIDNSIRMEQLLNTHPEFEKALDDFAHSAGGKEYVNTSRNFLNAVTGRNMTNRILMAGGFSMRMAAKGAAAATGATMLTFLGAPVIGGVIGAIRGKIRGETMLSEKQKQARHGQKDASKERIAMTDAARLAKRLNKMTEEAGMLYGARYQRSTPEFERMRERKTNLLVLGIEHAQGKMQKGEVNFGGTKEALTNQFNFINSLNSALVLRAQMSATISHPLTGASYSMKSGINKLFSNAADKIAGKTSESRNQFIKKQIYQGAAMGAGLATAGYVLRYAGEQMGWWGGHGAEGIPQKEPIEEADASEGFMKRTQNWMAKLWEHKEANKPSGPVTQVAPGGARVAEEIRPPHEPPPAEPIIAEPTVPATPSATPPEEYHYQATGRDPFTPLVAEAPAAPTIENNFTGESITFDHGKGGIQGISELQDQIRHDFPDISKAPQSVQDFMNTDATKEAIKLGFYDPDNPNESAYITEGSVLKFDENGILHFGKPDVDGEIPILEKYEGNMFNVEEPTVTPEPVTEVPVPEEIPAEIPEVQPMTSLSTPEEYHARILEQMESGERPPLAGGGAIPDEVAPYHPPRFNEYGRPVGRGMRGMIPGQEPPGVVRPYNQPRYDEYGRSVGPGGRQEAIFSGNLNRHREVYGGGSGRREYIPGMSELQTHSEFAENPFHLSGAKLMATYHVHQQNLSYLLPENTADKWRAISQLKAKDIFESQELEEGNIMAPLIAYLHKLQEVTDLEPTGGFIRRNESAEHYIARALQKAAQMGRLEEVAIHGQK